MLTALGVRKGSGSSTSGRSRRGTRVDIWGSAQARYVFEGLRKDGGSFFDGNDGEGGAIARGRIIGRGRKNARSVVVGTI